MGESDKNSQILWGGQCHFGVAFSALSALLLSSEFLLLSFEGFDEVDFDRGKLILGAFAEFLILCVCFQLCHLCLYTDDISKGLSILLFKGLCRSPKTRKKGRIKVYPVIHANERVPSNIKFTSAATNDSFILYYATLSKGNIIAIVSVYIDYEKFQLLMDRDVI